MSFAKNNLSGVVSFGDVSDRRWYIKHPVGFTDARSHANEDFVLSLVEQMMVGKICAKQRLRVHFCFYWI